MTSWLRDTWSPKSSRHSSGFLFQALLERCEEWLVGVRFSEFGIYLFHSSLRIPYLINKRGSRIWKTFRLSVWRNRSIYLVMRNTLIISCDGLREELPLVLIVLKEYLEVVVTTVSELNQISSSVDSGGLEMKSKPPSFLLRWRVLYCTQAGFELARYFLMRQLVASPRRRT